jgi:hypothetical protein
MTAGHVEVAITLRRSGTAGDEIKVIVTRDDQPRPDVEAAAAEAVQRVEAARDAR